MDNQLLDLGFSFCEQLDIAIASADTSLDKYLRDVSSYKELAVFVLELLGTLRSLIPRHRVTGQIEARIRGALPVPTRPRHV